jgi:dipeptidyl aminopeptidase/acylaminoacyl peptidase
MQKYKCRDVWNGGQHECCPYKWICRDTICDLNIYISNISLDLTSPRCASLSSPSPFYGEGVGGEVRLPIFLFKTHYGVRWIKLLFLLTLILFIHTVRLAAQDAPAGRLLFVREALDGTRDIYAINADGTNEINLSDHPADDAYPVWSPDGTQIAFQSNRDGLWQVYVIDSDGGSLTRYSDLDTVSQRPGWRWGFDQNVENPSPVLVFQVDTVEFPRFAVFESTSQSPMQMLTIPDMPVYRPVPSPNGRLTAFHTRRDGSINLSVFDVEGDAVVITPAGANDGAFAWSPDSTLIAFERNGEIYAVTMGTYVEEIGVPRNVTVTTAYEEQPAWSPDGTALVYVSNGDIVTSNADGGNPLNLTQSVTYDAAPAWSPDGTQIAFASFRVEDDWELYVMNANGCNVRRLTNARGWDGLPQWQPQPNITPVASTERAPAAIVTTAQANLRAGGSENAVIVGSAAQGECLTITGRDASGAWLQIRTDAGVQAWISTTIVSVIGDTAGVPVP